MAEATKVTFYGTRGSTPCSGPEYARYGGNTSCVVVEGSDESVIFDMGTGFRSFGSELNGNADALNASVLLSHLHWDHVQGLPFFKPLATSRSHLEIFGPAQEGRSLGSVFCDVLRQPFFPIDIDDLPGSVAFVDVESDDFPIGGAKARSRWIRHTSPTLGYRLDIDGVSIAYVSDHGPGCSDDPEDFIPQDVLDLADGVDLLIHDSQHSCGEFGEKRHFGHSTYEYAVHVARQSGAKRLALFHHCPTHSDDDVDEILGNAQDLAEASSISDLFAAADGTAIALSP